MRRSTLAAITAGMILAGTGVVEILGDSSAGGAGYPAAPNAAAVCEQLGNGPPSNHAEEVGSP